MHPEFKALLDAASRPYLAAGLYAYFSAREKLRHDPVFFSVLRMGRIPDRARMLDLGCGQAVLASLLLAAQARFQSGLWPAEWTAPPSELLLLGIEAERRAARRAQITLGDRAIIHAADLRNAQLPEADVVVMIDVLHYLEMHAQVSLLEKVARSLRGGGLLIMRVADISAGWRFHAGTAMDHVGSLLSARAVSRHFHRPIDEWMQMLDGLGFEPSVEPAGPEKSFANVLLWARASATGKA